VLFTERCLLFHAIYKQTHSNLKQELIPKSAVLPPDWHYQRCTFCRTIMLCSKRSAKFFK